MEINGLDTDEKVMIIAEIGNNHEGDLEVAKKMISLAKEAGADAVKFQTIIPEKLVSEDQVERIALLKKFQFDFSQFESLADCAQNEGIVFLSTPFDLESVSFLNTLVPAFKIASGDNDFFPMIEKIAETGKPILLSAGMTMLEDILKTRDFINEIWRNNGFSGELAVLHCVSSYPTPPEEANLSVIENISRMGVTPGYSDHTLGIDASVLAVALGARIIEKHFTINHHYSDFRDHMLSADPDEMTALVARIRLAETLIGNGEKIITTSEAENRPAIRRSVAAGKDLDKGIVIGWDDLGWVRPSSGIRPGEEDKIIGKLLLKDMKKGELFSMEHVE